MRTHQPEDTKQESKAVAQQQAMPSANKAVQFADNREGNLLQRQQQTTIQKANKTGLPDNIKSGVESLSGIDISDVRVHRNSAKPASVQAHAYTQGTDIHVASDQEKHLAHEAWHVVQQKQGRVQPTTTVNGMAVNDNATLEKEADVMGGMAVQKKTNKDNTGAVANSITQKKSDAKQSFNRSNLVAQRVIFMPNKDAGTDLSKLKRLGLFDSETGKPNEQKFKLVTLESPEKENIYSQFLALVIDNDGVEIDNEGGFMERGHKKLLDWIGDTENYNTEKSSTSNLFNSDQIAKRRKTQIPGESRFYNTPREAAYAIYNDLLTEENLRKQRNLATEILGDKANKTTLINVVIKTQKFIKGKEYTESQKGVFQRSPTYTTLHNYESYQNLLDIKKETLETKSTSVLAAIMHDLKDLSATLNGSFEKDRTSFSMKTTKKVPKLHGGGIEEKELSINKKDMRYNVSTVDEADDFSLMARENREPIWAGPSYTIESIINLTLQAYDKGTTNTTVLKSDNQDDKEARKAVASAVLSTFALWNADKIKDEAHYGDETSPVHRLLGCLAPAFSVLDLRYEGSSIEKARLMLEEIRKE